MISRTRLILIALVSVIILIGVGFAAITSTQLNITGNTVANPDQSNFIVKFLETTEVSDSGKVTAEVVDDTHATLEVRGLVTKSDYVTATYIMKNMSDDLSADIAIAIGNNNEEYFSTTAELEKTSLKAGEEAKIVVRVELIKVPKTQDETAKVTAIIEATPVQPGEEGTSGAVPPELPMASPSELFDPTGENEDGLHIGDFVNYDAGTWTEEEINSIQTGKIGSLVTANNSTVISTLKQFQFGGFTVGSSRNGNVTPSSTTYNYVKDAETGEAITGWRVFDVEGDAVTLISAGNPESYHTTYSHHYESEYILTGNINSRWSAGSTAEETYQKRNWDMYVNTSQYGASAGVLTTTMLDAWYTKYTDSPNADIGTTATFQKIYQEPYLKYQNMIDNYSQYCWIATAKNDGRLYCIISSGRYVTGFGGGTGNTPGIRVIITLDSNVQFTATKAGTKTVTGGNMDTYGGDQTYNVWDIY